MIPVLYLSFSRLLTPLYPRWALNPKAYRILQKYTPDRVPAPDSAEHLFKESEENCIIEQRLKDHKRPVDMDDLHKKP